MDFRNAERYCIDNYGGHLASIHNIYGNMLITDTTRKVGAQYGNHIFLGANRFNSKWSWNDNSSFNFNNWHTGEPVNREERDVERDCLGIDIAFGFWFALNCYGNHPFVCQTRSLSSITTDTPPSTTVQTHKCSQNGQLSPNGQSCWYVQNKTADFVNAEMTCTRNFNGHLASIHSIFDNIKLTDVAREVAAYYGNMFIAGANRLSGDGIWSWTDGSPFNFNDWAQDEPGNEPTLNSLVIDIAFGAWFAANAYDEHVFVCETPSVVVKPPKCLPNGELSSDGKSCWYIQNVTMDFVNAEIECKNLYGGHLASIHSESDNIKLSDLTRQIANHYGGIFYIGGIYLRDNWGKNQ
uniref:C-type lectin domain-containing protein n=1 Tax=Panagrolaimus sp. JU765 TaxID=591449 RepID=A0AC34QUZ7_9BILA